MTVPMLETARLRLRAHDRSDLDACAAMWAAPSVTEYTIRTPSTRRQTWMRMLAYRGHWTLHPFGYWAVEERESKKYIGELGFANFLRGISADFDDMPELGWAFAPHAHGKGYATEGVLAALGWADRELAAERTYCVIDPANLASIRVAEKAGYTLNGTVGLGSIFTRPRGAI